MRFKNTCYIKLGKNKNEHKKIPMLLKQTAFVMSMWERVKALQWLVIVEMSKLPSHCCIALKTCNKFYKYGSTGHKVYAKYFCGHVEKHNKIDNFPLPAFIHIKAITSGKADGNRKIIVSAEKVCTLARGGFPLVQKKGQRSNWELGTQSADTLQNHSRLFKLKEFDPGKLFLDLLHSTEFDYNWNSSSCSRI